MEDKVVGVMSIKLIDMPNMDAKFTINAKRCVNLSKQVVNDRTETKLAQCKKNAFTALCVNLKKAQRKDYLMSKMLSTFKKYHLFHEFNKLNQKTNILAEIRDKDKINGAFLLMKRFKNRLKAFDEAMQALNRQKVNITDFEKLSASLDFTRAETIFKDMVSLVDSNSRAFEEKVERER